MSDKIWLSTQKLVCLAEKFNVQLDEQARQRYELYAKLLVEWNNKINLTAITDPDSIAVKHFADSISILKWADIPQGAKLIDVGCGAGLPGIALLIARPDLNITLLDSTEKKLKVVANILDELGLTAKILHKRAEEAGKDENYREKFDFATARAVANMNQLSEYCLPFVKKGGKFIAMKAARSDEEINQAKKAIEILGGKIVKKADFTLDTAGERCIIVIEKVKNTPNIYPRAKSQMIRRPI